MRDTNECYEAAAMSMAMITPSQALSQYHQEFFVHRMSETGFFEAAKVGAKRPRTSDDNHPCNVFYKRSRLGKSIVRFVVVRFECSRFGWNSRKRRLFLDSIIVRWRDEKKVL